MENRRVLADAPSFWEQHIRAREHEARRVFLATDIPTLDALWAPGYVLNSPLNQILRKSQLLELIRSGRIRRTSVVTDLDKSNIATFERLKTRVRHAAAVNYLLMLARLSGLRALSAAFVPAVRRSMGQGRCQIILSSFPCSIR